MQSFRSIFRHGLIFGIGLIIPLVIINLGGSVLSYKLSSMLFSNEESVSSYRNNEEDIIKSITVQDFHDVREGGFVMVLGSVKNNGKVKANSVKLEAEFFNAEGSFVYEETAYISKNLKPNDVENFVIKCGCTSRTFPEYTKVTVRVVSVSNY